MLKYFTIDKSSKLLGREACDKLIQRVVPMNLVNKHEICATNGCYLYDAIKDVDLISCPICDCSRNIKKELKTINIAAKLSELLACDDVRERLAYRFEQYPNSEILQPSQETVYRDAFDGELYAKFVKDGHFDNKYDIALKIDIDGFRSKFSSTKMTMIHCVILNYDISEVSKNDSS